MLSKNVDHRPKSISVLMVGYLVKISNEIQIKNCLFSFLRYCKVLKICMKKFRIGKNNKKDNDGFM